MKNYTKEPFDLEKAKAGHPLITRGGKEAFFVGVLEDSRFEGLYPLSVFIVEMKQTMSFTKAGKFYTNRDDEDDIFLKVEVAEVPVPKEPIIRWKWAYRHKKTDSWHEDLKFFTEEEAENTYSKSYEYAKLEYTRTEFKS